MAENDNNIKFFDKEKLDEMISHYLNDIDSFWKDEEYKWQAVQHFQNHWNIDSDDFEGMLKESTSKHLNLLGSGNYFPIGVLLDIAKDFYEDLRSLFKILYDENSDLVRRINDFQKGIKDIYSKTSNPGKNTYQDLRAVSVLLWLRFPEKYYIYKSTELKKSFKLLGGKVPKLSDKADCFPQFLEYMNDLNAYFLSNETFKRKISSHINSNSLYEDKSLHTATIDFIFYTGKRFVDNDDSEINDNNDISDMNDFQSKLLEEYKYFLLNCTTVGASIRNYTDFKRINQCIEELGLDEESVLDFDDSSLFEQVVNNLVQLDSFIKINSKGGNQYLNALKYYLRFLKARNYFGNLNGLHRRSKVGKPQQIIYYGAPGTGKSYGIKMNHGVTRDNSFRTTFHPDTDYSSFVGCYKPTKKVLTKRNISEEQLATILKDRINNPDFKYPYHKFGFDYWRELADYKKNNYVKWIK